MSEEVLTVEQFAERLKLHPKTVLRFIREGRLRAVKVGRSWRILRSDLEAFGIPMASQTPRLRVTSIVDIPDVTPQEAQRLAALATSLRMGNEARPEQMNINVAHDPIQRQLKIILVGAAGDVAGLLRMIEVWLEQQR